MYSLNRQAADDRGQVGIGTLIVFIAMVLVAAIAAGVLINTAGFLQSSSQATGEGASDATSNRLQVVSVTGVHLGNDGVGVVDLVVKRGPGASNVDLATTTIEWVGPTGSFYQLAEDGADGSPDGRFVVDPIQDNDDSDPVLNDQEDRLKIRLDLGSDDGGDLSDGTPFGNELGEGESATVRITTASGASTETRIVVPPTISGTSAVQL
ncbi:archaellin/type IV pilin N-terminal domain-containing protein [Haloarcula onubensis]|uniref:Flagellin n=1 Tax=Haloarcula onubensis TaxID=2950539 RepID=A0ABU2FPY2_9EURY|nr:archaellin/type IV pilin N-terminal domain-containing protein [Halomicroarcula sp. S3CR25-11]MDS0282362.1 flagellin [Halomicroarcula sp. S3CR25-11]